MSHRRDRLAAARLYLVAPARAVPATAAAALAAGADVVQLREKDAPDAAIVGAARLLRDLCDAHGALLIVNDRPDLALACGADGVHVGQDDIPVEDARAVVGPDRLVGISTHTPTQVEAGEWSSADYLGVGPVAETPTKPGRAAVGLALVRHAARATTKPFFAIGGIDAELAPAVVAAGGRRIAVARAICDAGDPGRATRELVRALAAAAAAA